MPGTLYVVSTPIGNLGDVSDRAREILTRVAVVACEDTRVTGRLLRRFQIRVPVVSYHEHNEAERARELLARLEEGSDVALVSDAGTPLVSDPGYRLVRAAREKAVPIRAVPGPSAVLAALAIAGLPPSPFTFLGFLPARGRARETALESLASLDHTFVLFESGARIARLLSELARALGPRRGTLLREMTKLHEEHRSGTMEELALWARDHKRKGELTLVVEGTRTPAAGERTAPLLSSLRPRFLALRESGLSARAAVKLLAAESGVPSRRLYQELAVAPEEARAGARSRGDSP